MTEQMMRELIEEEGLSEEVARLRMRDEDLWVLHPGTRFDEDLQGEEGVRLWQEAATLAQSIADSVSNGPDTIKASPAITQLVWDAAVRAEAALARARRRRREPRAQMPEEEERLRGLLERCDTHSNAYGAVLAEDVPNSEMKAKTLATLREMKEEAKEKFRRRRQELGIPDPTV
jgi:hypothetical protein